MLLWSPEAAIGTPAGMAGQLADISCPSLAFCAAVSSNGDVATSTDPTDASSWKVTTVDPYAGAVAISCPSSSMCVGADPIGDLIASGDPMGGAAAWSVGNPFGATTYDDLLFHAIACPSTTVCVVAAPGALATTTSSGGWQEIELPGMDVTDVSCPSTSLCVASYDGADTDGVISANSGVLTSTDPTGGAEAWTATNLNQELNGVSCPTVSLCVATANEQNVGLVLTSTDPTGGAGAWSTVTADSNTTLQAVDCASTTLCVAGNGGETAFSSDPTGGPGAWGIDDAPEGGVAQAVSCPLSTSTCIAIGGDAISVGTLVAAHTMSVSLAGSGSGSVRGSSGAFGILCPGTCSSLAPADGTATLLATPGRGSFFAGWGRPCTKRAAKLCKVRMSADKAVTATFDGDRPSCVTKPSATIRLGRELARARTSIDTLTLSVKCDQKTRLAVGGTITATLRKKTRDHAARSSKIALTSDRVVVKAAATKAIKLKLPAAALADLRRHKPESLRIHILERGAHGSNRLFSTVPSLHAKRG